jgi:hypothetical protein
MKLQYLEYKMVCHCLYRAKWLLLPLPTLSIFFYVKQMP